MKSAQTTRGTTRDGRGWTRRTDASGMPRATNAYWTDEKRTASELRAADKAAQAEQADAMGLPAIELSEFVFTWYSLSDCTNTTSVIAENEEQARVVFGHIETGVDKIKNVREVAK